MSLPAHIVTERLDAWVEAEGAFERLLVVVEALLALLVLAIAAAALWRCVAPVGPISGLLTHPIAISAALGFAVAAIVGRALPGGQAALPELRVALGDALSEALGRQPAADIEAVVQDAFGPERIRAAVSDRLTADALSTQIDAALADQEPTSDPDAAFDDVIAALDRAVVRARIARWLTDLLADRPGLIDGIARPVTRRLLRDSWFDRPFSWGKLNKQTRRFLERRKGRDWAEEVVSAVLDDFERRPPRARAAIDAILPATREAVSRRMGREIGERLRETADFDALITDAAENVDQSARPALLGALGHMVDERAAAAALALEIPRLRGVLRRSADRAARRLRLACFAGGAAVGALPTLWG